MKVKFLITALVTSLFIAHNVHAYEIRPLTKNVFSKSVTSNELKPVKQELVFYPLSFVMSGFELGTEILTKPNNTFRISAGYFMSNSANSYNTFSESFYYNSMEGFRSELQYRFYSRDFSAPDNFFLGIYGVYKHITLKGEQETYNNMTGVYTTTPINHISDAVSMGTVLGYRTRFYDIFSMDFFFGGGITPTNIGNASEAHTFMLPFRKSINLRAGLTLGIKI